MPYRLTIDGEVIEEAGVKCYVVNSARMGSGLSIDVDFSAEDGLLDVFIVGKDFQTIASTTDRFLKVPTKRSELHHWQGKEIVIEADPSQEAQLESVCESTVMVTAVAGSETITLDVTLQPFISVTVTPMVPALSMVAVISVSPLSQL